MPEREAFEDVWDAVSPTHLKVNDIVKLGEHTGIIRSIEPLPPAWGGDVGADRLKITVELTYQVTSGVRIERWVDADD